MCIYSPGRSVVKQSVGKDLTKISMPVVFNEPLSFCQRLGEDMEYCALLDKAWCVHEANH
jgi:hypothetical protein